MGLAVLSIYLLGFLFLNISYIQSLSLSKDRMIEGPYSLESVEIWMVIQEELPDTATFIFYKPRVLNTGLSEHFAQS